MKIPCAFQSLLEKRLVPNGYRARKQVNIYKAFCSLNLKRNLDGFNYDYPFVSNVKEYTNDYWRIRAYFENDGRFPIPNMAKTMIPKLSVVPIN